MNTKIEKATSGQGSAAAKLILAAAVLIGGFVAYFWFSELNQAVRLLILVAGVALSGFIASFTPLGSHAKHFFIETRFEVRKVVWPTRDETIKTTGIVILVVVLISLLLGLIDLILKTVVLDWLL